ncbi:hypothetical protein AC574_12485, partial [Mannheimia haemolytica]
MRIIWFLSSKNLNALNYGLKGVCFCDLFCIVFNFYLCKIECNSMQNNSTAYKVTQSAVETPETLTLSELQLQNKENSITGDNFVKWLKSGIATNKFAINKPTAKLHIVEDHLFLVTPVIFEMY